jgi:TonB family protein
MNFHRATLALLLISFALSAAAQTTEPTQLSDSAAQGLLIKKVNPVYPPLARQARIQGTVLLGITISKSGDVENMQLISGHPMLGPAAIEAVKQWKYQPYLVNGDPVEVQTRVLVNFVLAAADEKVDTPDGSASGNQDSSQRVRVSENVMRSLRIQEIDASYPQLALRARVVGLVVLKEFIDQSGNVENLDLISGDPLLAPAAMDAVRQWKYRPYLLNGEPVEVETLVRVNFALSKEKPSQGSAEDGPLPDPIRESVPTLSPAENAPSPQANPSRIRISSAVARGLLVQKVNPQYPLDAKYQNVQGVVVMSATIDPEGHVTDLQLISGHPMLAPAAMDAVKQWKYKPFLVNGNPVTVETQIQVNFTLSN